MSTVAESLAFPMRMLKDGSYMRFAAVRAIGNHWCGRVQKCLTGNTPILYRFERQAWSGVDRSRFACRNGVDVFGNTPEFIVSASRNWYGVGLNGRTLEAASHCRARKLVSLDGAFLFLSPQSDNGATAQPTACTIPVRKL